MERNDNKIRILVASFGTFSTGISIHKIFNIFLTESYKSEVIIKQSIGRGMRLFEGKDAVNIIDFVDDFTYRGQQNYIMKHAEVREDIYAREKFKYKKIRVKL
jgi:type I site-specific restriction endonuclease